MNSCDKKLNEVSKNTYLFKRDLRKIMFFFVKVTEFPGVSCYLSSDRHDGKFYLNVENSIDDSECREFIAKWIRDNSELVDCYSLEVIDYENEIFNFIIKLS